MNIIIIVLRHNEVNDEQEVQKVDIKVQLHIHLEIEVVELMVERYLSFIIDYYKVEV